MARLGQSEAVEKLKSDVALMSRVDISVLLPGVSGTGKNQSHG